DGGVDGGSGADMAVTDTGTFDSGGDVDAGTVDSGGVDSGGVDSGVRVPMNHRPDDGACTTAAPPGDCSFGGGPGMCSHDSDCTMGTNGRCNMNMGGAIFCRCTYDTCAHDT